MKRAQASLICAALLLPGSPANAQTQNAQRWDFQVFLDDAPIGFHHYTLRESGAERELKIEARFDVKLLFITAYRYTHAASERWRGHCLTQLSARTDDNGDKSEISTEQQGERLTISAITNTTTQGGRESADGCVMSFAYWNPEMLRQTRLLNAQTGKLETVTVTPVGEEKITVRGTLVAARRYRISGAKHPIDLWYGSDRQWLALQSTLESGRRLRYQLK